MPRILGIDLPNNKKILIALTYIYGIGRKTSEKILQTVNIDPEIRAKEISDEDLSKLASEIQKNYTVEGPLHRQIRQNVQRLKDIQCYRGFRHRRGLPVRGQRTQSNARTRKGPKKTVAGKKKAVKG